MIETLVNTAALLFCLSVLILTVGSVLALRGARTIDDDAPDWVTFNDPDGQWPCSNPDCGLCRDAPNEAAAALEKAITDVLRMSEVDHLNRMWRT